MQGGFDPNTASLYVLPAEGWRAGLPKLWRWKTGDGNGSSDQGKLLHFSSEVFS
jgi:hypothetical protein